MRDFSNLNADEVLNEFSLNEYKTGMDFLRDQLIKLNTNNFLIKKIIDFPFEFFCAPTEKTFFSMVVWNFFENSVLIVTKLTTDQGADLFTLFKFKNWLVQNIKQEYKSDFCQKLKEVKFDPGVKQINKKAKILRDYSAAHFNKDVVFGKIRLDNLDFPELEILRDKINSFFCALAFNVEYGMLPLPYSEKVIRPEGIDYRTDIGSILDSIAKNSDILNMPEHLPEIWKITKENYDDEGIKIFNKYRKKFNLPEVKNNKKKFSERGKYEYSKKIPSSF